MFGLDRLKPNIPIVPISVCSSLVVYGWGPQIIGIDTDKKKEVFRISTFIAQDRIHDISVSSNYVVYVTDLKTLVVHNLLNQKDQIYHLKKRAVSVEIADLNPLKVVLAEKFGDIIILNDLELAANSSEIKRSCHQYIQTSPKDKFYREQNRAVVADIELNGFDIPTDSPTQFGQPAQIDQPAHVDPTEPLKGRYWGDRETPEAQDECLKGCVNGHLATVTSMRVCQVHSPVLREDVRLLVAADRDEKVRVSRFPDLHVIEAILCGHEEFITDTALLRGGGIVSGAADKTLRLWSMQSKELDRFPCGEDTPLRLAQIDQTRFVSIFCDSKKALVLRVVDSRFEVELTIECPSMPVAVAVVGSKIVFVDTVGSSVVYELSCFTQINDQSEGIEPLIVRPWKHTHENNAPSPSERLAKRLKHTSVMSQ